MNKLVRSVLFWSLLLGIIGGVPALRATAQGGYPNYTELEVNDYAGILSAEDGANIRQHLQELRTTTGIEATVLTISSISDYGTGDTTIESFATNLFNAWGIGDPARNDGVLILVAIDDRELRIEVGSGYDASVDNDMQNVINEFILPDFRAGDFSGGIYSGVRATIFYLTGEWPPNLRSGGEGVETAVEDSSPNAQPSSAAVTESRGLGGWWADLMAGPFPYIFGGSFLAVLAGGLAVLRANWYKWRKQSCDVCHSDMRLTSEIEDDAYLDSGQLTEESIGSVNHFVWECRVCGNTEQARLTRFFSGYHSCPSCRYKTAANSSRTLSAATEYATGVREVTEYCSHCNYERVYTEVIPRIQRSDSSSSSFGSSSSSSSSSSFSGGSSSGGGASGSW